MGDNIQIKRMVKDIVQFRDGLEKASFRTQIEYALVVAFFKRYMDGEIESAEEGDKCCQDGDKLAGDPVSLDISCDLPHCICMASESPRC